MVALCLIVLHEYYMYTLILCDLLLCCLSVIMRCPCASTQLYVVMLRLRVTS